MTHATARYSPAITTPTYPPASTATVKTRLTPKRARCVETLRLHRDHQDQARELAAGQWQDNDLVFASAAGTALDAANVRRAFRKVIAAAGLNPAEWTPRELRHSFVSLLSDAGVPVEKIARLVGHSGTATTELVYRNQIRPVVTGGAEVMDSLFPRRDTGGTRGGTRMLSYSVGYSTTKGHDVG